MLERMVSKGVLVEVQRSENAKKKRNGFLYGYFRLKVFK